MNDKLQDDDPMPFGKYKGVPMMDVPVSYLHWFWHNSNKQGEVCMYIKENLSGLKMENKDLIWEN